MASFSLGLSPGTLTGPGSFSASFSFPQRPLPTWLVIPRHKVGSQPGPTQPSLPADTQSLWVSATNTESHSAQDLSSVASAVSKLSCETEEKDRDNRVETEKEKERRRQKETER